MDNFLKNSHFLVRITPLNTLIHRYDQIQRVSTWVLRFFTVWNWVSERLTPLLAHPSTHSHMFTFRTNTTHLYSTVARDAVLPPRCDGHPHIQAGLPETRLPSKRRGSPFVLRLHGGQSHRRRDMLDAPVAHVEAIRGQTTPRVRAEVPIFDDECQSARTQCPVHGGGCTVESHEAGLEACCALYGAVADGVCGAYFAVQFTCTSSDIQYLQQRLFLS